MPVTVAGAACAVAGGCGFEMALAATPQLLTTTVDMPPASEGGSLVARGHGFSLVDAENWVMVGGEPCVVNSATVDGSYVHPPCPVASCTDDLALVHDVHAAAEPRDLGAHTVTAGVYGLGAAPARSGAAVTYAVQLRGAHRRRLARRRHAAHTQR